MLILIFLVQGMLVVLVSKKTTEKVFVGHSKGCRCAIKKLKSY